MGMTMTQKILAAHAGLDSVTAGQLIEAKLDVVMANDITGPMALPIFRQMADKVFDKDKVVLVPDHFAPNKDIKSAENSKAIREFAKDQGLSWYFEQGKSGVEHAILPDNMPLRELMYIGRVLELPKFLLSLRSKSSFVNIVCICLLIILRFLSASLNIPGIYGC